MLWTSTLHLENGASWLSLPKIAFSTSILNLCVNSYINQSISHVQHTPNPDAQDPPLVPPLLEHSSLKSLIGLIYNFFIFCWFEKQDQFWDFIIVNQYLRSITGSIFWWWANSTWIIWEPHNLKYWH